MAIVLTDPLNSDTDLTLVQTDATVSVASNKITSTIVTAGASWNGAYGNNTRTLSNNDRYYFSYAKIVQNNPSVLFGTRRTATVLPAGFFSMVNTATATTQRATIWESDFGTPDAMTLGTTYYGLIVNSSDAGGSITIYYKTSGHSNTIGDYTELGQLAGGSDVGQASRMVLSHLGTAANEKVEYGPFAFTDSNGLPPPIPTDLAVTVDDDTTITLDFTDAGSSTNETGISIERSLSSGSGFTEIDTVAQGTETYEDSGLTPGTTYYYKIRSFVTFSGQTFYSSYTSVESGTTTGGDTDTDGEDALMVEILGD